MIARFDSEERFVSRLVSGFNIFTGAGFSVEAQSIEGKGFPIGQGLLEEIKGSSGVIVGEKHPQPQYLC